MNSQCLQHYRRWQSINSHSLTRGSFCSLPQSGIWTLMKQCYLEQINYISWDQEGKTFWNSSLDIVGLYLNTYLEAVKMCFEFVQMALIGLSCPLMSPTGVKLSTFQTFTVPPRQALSNMGRLGTKAKAQTQSLCAGICWKQEYSKSERVQVLS